MKYKFVYKCRWCGALTEVIREEEGNIYQHEDGRIDISVFQIDHKCRKHKKDHRRGVADLVGFVPIVEECLVRDDGVEDGS